MKGKPTTPEQRELLLKLYLEVGFQGTKRLAIKYGFDPRNLGQLARNAGIKQKPVITTIRRTRNKMWARAVANGSISI
jgi:hypothetical protein